METLSLLFGVLTLLAIITGGAVAFKLRKQINYLIAFCAGTLVAAALLEIFPEAIELLGAEEVGTVMQIALLSFIFFLLLDKLFLFHSHSHSEDDHNHDESETIEKGNPLGILSSVGILFHTFLDGLLIGTSFLVDSSTLILLGIVILIHDFTDGVSTVTVLLRHNQSRKIINAVLIGAGLSTIAGVVISQLFQPSEAILGYLFSGFAGFFLYLGATDLMSELQSMENSRKLVLFTVLGATLILGLTQL